MFWAAAVPRSSAAHGHHRREPATAKAQTVRLRQKISGWAHCRWGVIGEAAAAPRNATVLQLGRARQIRKAGMLRSKRFTTAKAEYSVPVGAKWCRSR
jgi:hypothetical protein